MTVPCDYDSLSLETMKRKYAYVPAIAKSRLSFVASPETTEGCLHEDGEKTYSFYDHPTHECKEIARN